VAVEGFDTKAWKNVEILSNVDEPATDDRAGGSDPSAAAA
jgi:hypothetical protein